MGGLLLLLGCEAETSPSEARSPAASSRLGAVQAFADSVLAYGRDRYGPEQTPLFVDGIRVDTREPVRWRYSGQEWVLSNFASQQNLLRVLVALSRLTGEARYRAAAEAATAYMFDHYQAEGGLLRWGGHQFVDLENGEPIGEFDADQHELKQNLPYYEFLWDVDPEGTRRFLRGFWSAHVLDWERLDMNRHGQYGDPIGRLWAHTFEQSEPFFEGEGLTFINTGTDLIHAGGLLSRLGGEEGARAWALRLAEQYVRARHPETGLGAYQYSKPERAETPPEKGPLTGQLTWSRYGDRAENQFGEVYGGGGREGWVLWGGRTKTIYVQNALVQLELAERLGGDDGETLRRWTVEGLTAYARHGYVPEENHFRPMWADGTDLTGREYPRTGYYGEKGTEFFPTEADGDFLFSYARAYRLSEEEALWTTLRQIAEGLGLGDVGEGPGQALDLNRQTEASAPATVFALLELARAASNGAPYLRLAEQVGDNLLEERYHGGFFRPSADHVYANFNTVAPLALLALEAARRGRPEAVPVYSGGEGYTHGQYEGRGRTYDHSVFWSQTR